VTDDRGIVRFDSDGGRDEGKDYSRWNDVYLTLGGRYGARATREDPDDPDASVLYIAAPLRVRERTVGVLSVGKPTRGLHRFIRVSRRKIVVAGTVAAGTVLILGVALTLWLTQPVRKLTRYVQAIRDGERMALPRLGRNEIGVMGKALEEMREALERKSEVERCVQILTHEVKGPLSAILGAAELLGEAMPPERRAQFLANIQTEAGRIQQIVDRLLHLSVLEARRGLRDVAELDLAAVAAEAADHLRPAIESRGIRLARALEAPVRLRGEHELVLQAVSNLLQNAVDFTPRGGTIALAAAMEEGHAVLTVSDTGPGVPDYALGRVFEKFFSLARPDTGRKSSGLGLSMVQEIAHLHGGQATLENRPEGGAKATLRLPVEPPGGPA